MVRTFLTWGDYVNHKDDKSTTGLMLAAWKGHNAIVKLLLEQPLVDLNSSDNEGNTALHFAAYGNNVEGVQLLLADPRLNTVNHPNNVGHTPVMLAMRTNSLAALHELVAHPNINLNAKDLWGRGLEKIAR